MTSPEMFALVKDGVDFSEERRLYVKNLSELSSKIPEKILVKNKNFIRTYFRAQLHIARGQQTKAREILRGLDKKVGFLDFEKHNEPLLAAIDIAVRGSTNRQDDLKRPIEPLFRLDKS